MKVEWEYEQGALQEAVLYVIEHLIEKEQARMNRKH